jgi:lipoprotein-releasing system ATP-binding protein
MSDPILRVEHLAKSYATARGCLRIFTDLNLTVATGELAAVIGPSGAGKSTLLHLVGALDRPDSGSITCAGHNLASLSPDAAADFRNRTVGFVWQMHYLLPEFTAAENVALPLLARETPRPEALAQAHHWLNEVGLADRAHHRSGELSGGEQQRVALARALVTRPRLLLADEPTGDLDAATAHSVFSLIERLHAAHGLATLLVTHNLELARRCHNIYRLSDGALARA